MEKMNNYLGNHFVIEKMNIRKNDMTGCVFLKGR